MDNETLNKLVYFNLTEKGATATEKRELMLITTWAALVSHHKAARWIGRWCKYVRENEGK